MYAAVLIHKNLKCWGWRRVAKKPKKSPLISWKINTWTSITKYEQQNKSFCTDVRHRKVCRFCISIIFKLLNRISTLNLINYKSILADWLWRKYFWIHFLKYLRYFENHCLIFFLEFKTLNGEITLKIKG